MIDNIATNSSATATVSIGLGVEAQKISENFKNANVHYSEPVSRTQIIKKFDQLSATWTYDNSVVSSSQDMVLSPAYQEIIGMGKAAIPLILEELENNPQYWFWALRSITGENPIKPEEKGNIKKMTESWLEWAKINGYVK